MFPIRYDFFFKKSIWDKTNASSTYMRNKINNSEMTRILAIVQTYEMNIENLKMYYQKACYNGPN